MIKVKDHIQDYEVLTSDNLIVDPKVSVLMPTYCRGDNGLLKRAIRSVLDQTFESFELIIIDDGSVDMTRQVVTEILKQEHRIIYIRNHKNSGLPSIKVMQGYFESRAPYIAYQFDDDQWYPHALQAMYDAIRTESEDTFVYGACDYIKVIDQSKFTLGDKEIDPTYLPFVNTLSNNAVMHHRRMFELYGAYDPSLLLRRATDWDMWKRWLQSGAKAKRVDSVISIVEEQRQGSLNMTVDKDIAIYKIMEAIDPKERNQKLIPENYKDYVVDDLSFVEDQNMQIQLYYEKLYPYYLSRIGQDDRAEKYIGRPWIPRRVAVLYPLEAYQRHEVPEFEQYTGLGEKYRHFYMAREQMRWDTKILRYADVIITDDIGGFTEKEQFMVRQRPVVELGKQCPNEREIDYLIQLAEFRQDIDRIHIIIDAEENKDKVIEEEIRQITGKSPRYVLLDQLKVTNYLIDSSDYELDLSLKLQEIGATAILNRTKENLLTTLIHSMGIPAVDADEIYKLSKIATIHSPILTAFYHKILYLRAVQIADIKRQKPENIAEFIDGHQVLQDFAPEDRLPSYRVFDAPISLKKPSGVKEMDALAAKNLEIEDLRAEIVRLRRKSVEDMGYLSDKHIIELSKRREEKAFAADLSELCMEYDEISTDRKVRLIRHMSGQNYKDMDRYLDVICDFAQEEMLQKGYYLGKSPHLSEQGVVVYTVDIEEEYIDSLTFCFTNYNPLARFALMKLLLTDIEDRHLYQKEFRGWEIPHRKPCTVQLPHMQVPTERKVKLFFFGKAFSLQAGISVFEWKKRNFWGKTKDQRPLMNVNKGK